MNKKVNPNLIKLAEQTHNPNLKIDETMFEMQVEEIEQTTAPDLKGYIYVPSIKLYVAKERSLKGKNWNQAQEELKKQKVSMPTPYQFREFLKFLRDSKNREHTEIFNDITEVRSPWRAEWLNARFEERNGLYMISENVLVNGRYQDIEQKLDNYLNKDKIPGISLDEWINSNASHGLPIAKMGKGPLYYRPPVKGCVAWFVSGSAWAALYCPRLPDSSSASLGVFACAEGAVAKNSRR